MGGYNLKNSSKNGQNERSTVHHLDLSRRIGSISKPRLGRARQVCAQAERARTQTADQVRAERADAAAATAELRQALEATQAHSAASAGSESAALFACVAGDTSPVYSGSIAARVTGAKCHEWCLRILAFGWGSDRCRRGRGIQCGRASS